MTQTKMQSNEREIVGFNMALERFGLHKISVSVLMHRYFFHTIFGERTENIAYLQKSLMQRAQEPMARVRHPMAQARHPMAQARHPMARLRHASFDVRHSMSAIS